jgi:cytochrome P450
VSHYPLFHNPFYFSDPFSYRPSRWLLPSSPTAAEEDALRTAQLAFVPFSIGSRGCIGKNLAVMEMITTMARVIFAFDFEAEKVDGKEAEEGGVYHVRDAFICDKKGPWIVFKPRKV